MAKMRPEEIAATLRRAVRERVFPPGEALNQDDLARRFGVSRIPLREALRTLVGEGLILMKPGLGAVVTELQLDEVSELYGLRRQLEPPLAPHVVANVRPSDIADLASLTGQMADLDQSASEEWSNLNYRFHRRLYEISDRPHTVRLTVQVLNLVEPYARVYAHVLGRRPQLQEQRIAALDALRAADAQQLCAIVGASIDVALAALVASMSDPIGEDPLSGMRAR